MTILSAGMGEPDFYNLIRNGSFVGHADGWLPGNDTQTMGYNAASRSAGSGSLSLASADNSGNADYRPGGAFAISVEGNTHLDFIAYAKPSVADQVITLELLFMNTSDGHPGTTFSTVNNAATTPLLSDAAFTEVPLLNVEVPVGATHVRPRIKYTEDIDYLIDDVYLGPPGQAAPPYPGAAAIPFLTNRILNGDFHVNLDGWHHYGAEVFVRDTVAPIADVASLKVTTPGGSAFQGAFYVPQGSVAVVGGETIRVQGKIKGAGTVRFNLWFGVEEITAWEDALSASVTVIDEEIVVPAGAWYCDPSFMTPTDQAITFTIDDVSLGTPPA